MLKTLFSLFLILHGLVHLLYFGHSRRLFEMQPGMTWPDGAWALSGFLQGQAIRTLASTVLVPAAGIIVAGGIGLLLRQEWWRPVTIISAGFSSVIFILFWDGIMQNLDNKGLFGVVINLAILAAVLLFGWPNV
jgi:hypothetical protein